MIWGGTNKVILLKGVGFTPPLPLACLSVRCGVGFTPPLTLSLISFIQMVGNRAGYVDLEFLCGFALRLFPAILLSSGAVDLLCGIICGGIRREGSAYVEELP